MLSVGQPHYENNSSLIHHQFFKIISPTWNDEFELPDGSYSVSDIQDYIEYIIKKMKQYLLILLFRFTSTGSIVDSKVQNKRWI